MPSAPTTWKGGRIRYGRGGRPTYVIQRQVAGQRYVKSTRAHTISAALAHLERFEADPEGYDPRGGSGAPVHLNAVLAQAYLDYSKAEGNSRDWRRKQRGFLDWWAEKLSGLDLRRVSLQHHILPALKSQTSRHHRISVLKGLYTWLRTVRHEIATAEDPVFGQLPVPQSGAEQLVRSKVIPRDHVYLALEALVAPWRDALLVQAGTGWHTTEIVRFAKEGSVEAVPKHGAREGDAGVLVCPMRKSGEPQRTRVGTEVREAAKRLRKHGAISREWYDRAVKAACASVKHPDGRVGIPAFSPGRLRHSVASWAIEAGADPAAVAAFLGHRSPRTTRKFYATHVAPARVPTLA